MKLELIWIPPPSGTGPGSLTAKAEETTIHTDRGDIGSASFRDAFIQEVCRLAKGVDEHELRAALVERAARESEALDSRRARSSPAQQAGLTTAVEYQPLPLSALPGVLGEFVAAAAAALICDPSYVALALLVALAAAIGNGARIVLKGSWSEPAVLWGAIVGDSETQKSPAFDVALHSLMKIQEAAFAAYHEALKKYQVRLRKYEADMAEWKKNGHKAGHAPPTVPHEPSVARYICSDITIEALVALLNENPRGLLAFNDELAAWMGSFDQYRQGSNSDAARWLSIHRAGSVTKDRRTGDTRFIHVPHAAVSVLGSIQPQALARVLGRMHFENGMAARLLVTMPPWHPKRWTEATIPPLLQGRIERVFKHLLTLYRPDRNPPTHMLPLTAKAKRIWVAFYNEHAKEQGEVSGDMRAAWSKLEGYAARISLIFHLLEWADSPRPPANPGPVRAQSIRAAIEMTRWFGTEASRVYASLRESSDHRELRQLLDVIRARGGEVRVRDLRHSRLVGATSQGAEEALDRLVAAGLGRWVERPASAAGGRPTRVFKISRAVPKPKTPENP